MPIKQDFSTFRQPIDPYRNLTNVLSGLSQQVGQAAGMEQRGREFQQSQQLARDKYDLLKSEADRKNAERAAMDKFNKAVAEGPQDVSGLLTDVVGATPANKKVLEGMMFTPKEQKEYEAVQGDLSKLTGTTKTKAAQQLQLGSLAGTAPLQETQVQMLQRAMGQASESGVVPEAMRKELQLAQAAEATALGARRTGLEKLLADAAKSKEDKVAEAAKFRSNELSYGPKSKKGGTGKEYRSRIDVMKKINKELPNTDWGSGALGGKDLKDVANDYMTKKNVPPEVMAYAIEYLKEGNNDAWLDKDVEVNKKALEDTITSIMNNPQTQKDILNGYSNSNYDTTYEDVLMKQAGEAGSSAKAAQAKLDLLRLSPEERQAAGVQSLFEDMFGTSARKPAITTGGQKAASKKTVVGDASIDTAKKVTAKQPAVLKTPEVSEEGTTLASFLPFQSRGAVATPIYDSNKPAITPKTDARLQSTPFLRKALFGDMQVGPRTNADVEATQKLATKLQSITGNKEPSLQEQMFLADVKNPDKYLKDIDRITQSSKPIEDKRAELRKLGYPASLIQQILR